MILIKLVIVADTVSDCVNMRGVTSIIHQIFDSQVQHTINN